MRFSPTAWAKLLYFRDRQGTEIGGFGITRADDLLFVEEFLTVKQEVTVASVSFDDSAVADFFDHQVDAGRKPEQFARIWLHSHPGESPQPSATDEGTFERVFGSCQWAVMFILGKSGKSYVRLRFNVGPRAEAIIPVETDYSRPFERSDRTAWEAEYKANIKSELPGKLFGSQTSLDLDDDYPGVHVPEEWIEEFEAMGPSERRFILNELAGRPDLWEESEVFYDF